MAEGFYSLNGTKIPHDAEGYIKDITSWSEDLAAVIARSEGIELTPAHWQLIHLVRSYYDEFAIAPDIRILVKYMRKQLGREKGSKEYLSGLFPGPASPAARLCKIAGLPKPTGCI